jgi:hypothetical protein
LLHHRLIEQVLTIHSETFSLQARFKLKFWA